MLQHFLRQLGAPSAALPRVGVAALRPGVARNTSCRGLVAAADRLASGRPDEVAVEDSPAVLRDSGRNKFVTPEHKPSKINNGGRSATFTPHVARKVDTGKSRHSKQPLPQTADEGATAGEVLTGNSVFVGSPDKVGGGRTSSGVLPPLSPVQELAVAAHRDAIDAIREAVSSVDCAVKGDVQLLRAQLDRLDDGLFLLVVVGEYNSGKSSCINALLGRRVLEEGVLPTTAEVTVLRYSSQAGVQAVPGHGGQSALENGVAVLPQDIDLLKTVSLVDSPGTNAIDRRHEALTKEYLPMCDLVLFVTSADRPFSESERQFLQSIRSWGKKCILLINKADLLPSSEAKQQVEQFVKTSSRALLGSSPMVFPVSSREALNAKLSRTGALGPHFESSGFGALESYISETLDSSERLQIKLDSVSSVSSTVANSYVERIAADSAILAADQASLATVSDLVQRCRTSVERGFPAHFARVDNSLLELVERADVFFDTHISLGNIGLHLKKDAIATAFMDQVVRDVERDVERRTRNLAEWVSDKLTRNIADVASIFSRRIGERKSEVAAVANMSGNEVSTQLETRGGIRSNAVSATPLDANGKLVLPGSDVTEQLMSGLGDAAAQITATYQPAAEGKNVANAVSGSVRTAVALELGAAGTVGALVSTSSLDFSGVVAATGLAAGGLVVIPRRRRALRAEVRSRVESLRTKLERELHGRVVEQMELHADRINVAVEPFQSHAETAMTANSEQSAALLKSLGKLDKVRQQVRNSGYRAAEENEGQ